MSGAGDVLPELTPIPGLELRDPYDLLTEDERAQLLADLDRMARQRRRAEARARCLPMT